MVSDEAVEELIDERAKEIFNEIEAKHKYVLDKKVHGQQYIITIGQKQWEKLKKSWSNDES